MARNRKPKLAVWKFSSCDGCQLTLLDCEDELLAVAGALDLVRFAEASSDVGPGPYDVSLVEGSIATARDACRIVEVRAASKLLIAIGACATSGGVQALRDGRDLGRLAGAVYPRPELLDALATSTPVSAHVKVDLELRGCPVSKRQLLEVIAALLAGRRPQIRSMPVCFECKARGNVCVAVGRGLGCLGPITHAGCGALCPSYGRGCYGCFGPSDGARRDLLPASRDAWVYR